MGRAGLSAAEKRVLLAELLRKKAAENTAKFPLSYGQKALLYLTRLDPDAPTYNAMFVIRVQAELNIDSLRAALQEMIDRHAALRSTYGLQGEQFVQRVHAASEVDFAACDASTWNQDQPAQVPETKVVSCPQSWRNDLMIGEHPWPSPR